MIKKILFLIHDLGPGGAEKVLVNLVNKSLANKNLANKLVNKLAMARRKVLLTKLKKFLKNKKQLLKASSV